MLLVIMAGFLCYFCVPVCIYRSPMLHFSWHSEQHRSTVHIPVIIGSIVLGPAAGAFLGAVFGICSMISNTQAPTLLSFAFSPFLSTTGLVGVIKALWISIGCRVMIGVVSGWLSIALKNINVPTAVRLAITGFVGSMTNTVFVMGSIYLLFAQQYAEVKNVGMEAVSAW